MLFPLKHGRPKPNKQFPSSVCVHQISYLCSISRHIHKSCNIDANLYVNIKYVSVCMCVYVCVYVCVCMCVCVHAREGTLLKYIWTSFCKLNLHACA